MTLRWRVAVSLLIVVVAAFAVLMDRLVIHLKPGHRRSTEEPLVDTARVLAAVAAGGARDGKPDLALLARAFERVRGERFSASIYGSEKTRVDLVLYVTDARGRVIYDSRGQDVGRDYSTRNDVARTLAGTYGARTSHDDPADPQDSVMYVAAPVTIDGKLAGVLTVGKPSRTVNLAVEEARAQILMAGGLAAAAIVVLGFVVAGLATAPLEKLTAYARQVRDGGRPELPGGGSPEIRALATAFDEMREALEGKKYVQRYVQTLSHEMKSPLAALTGAAELLQEDMPPDRRARFLENIRSETLRLTDLVEKMLLLASLEHRGALELEPVEAGEVARAVAAGLFAAAAARGVTLDVEAPERATFRGERYLLRQALANLVQNAIDFSPPGARVLLSAGTGEGHVRFAVSDSGPGVPAYALSRVFERFFSLERPDTGRRSSGLGLALVREVAELHRGTAALANRPEGGARAELALPVEPAR